MKKLLASLAAVALLAGCGGGGGNGSGVTVGNSDGTTTTLSHNDLAARFVSELNASGEYSVTLAKDSTEQYNFIVIYDYDLREYDAVNISGYVPGANPVSFIETRTTVYYDLDFIPGGWETDYSYDWFCDCYVYSDYYVADSYYDWYSGLYFEKVQGASKDLEQAGALAEEAVVENRAEAVANKFGLSVSRGKEVVRLAMAWKKKGGKDLSEADQDSFSNAILGFSITEAKAAAVEKMAGNDKPLDELVQIAIENNDGLTPEEANQLMGEYFGVGTNP